MNILVNLMIFLPCLGAIGCLLVPTKQQAKQVALGTAVLTFALSMIVLYAYLDTDKVGVKFTTATSWMKTACAMLNGNSRPAVETPLS